MPIPRKSLDDIQQYIHNTIETVDDNVAYYCAFFSGNRATHLHNLKNIEVLPDLLREMADHLETGTFYDQLHDN